MFRYFQRIVLGTVLNEALKDLGGMETISIYIVGEILKKCIKLF